MTDTDTLKRQASLAAVIRSYGIDLQKQGSKLFAHCPFHDDSTPSFSLYYKAGMERWGCPACGLDGDVLDFIQKIEGVEFLPAVERLREHIGGVSATPLSGRNPEDNRKPKHGTKPGKVIATYDYTDVSGKLVFQVVRRETLDADTGEVLNQKHFSQRRPNGAGWVWDLKGVTRQLYRLSRLAAAETVWIVEGEKDVHSLEACGAIATTNAGGAKAQWEPQYTAALAGKHVIICGDSDAPGRERDATVATMLHGVAASISMVQLPAGLIKDVTDWFEAGQTLDALWEMATPFEPPKAEAAENGPPPLAEPPSGGNGHGPRVEFGSPPEGDWRAELLYNYQRNPKTSIANVEVPLRLAPEWRGVLAYSEFSGSVYARKPFPGFPDITETVQWSDQHDVALTVWLHHQGIMVGSDIAGKAVQRVAREYPFHPVREYLDGLTWDGMPRMDNWLIEYCRVSASNYAAAVGSAWLLSAVARIFRPGCKADCCLILEGEQGIRKSTALKILAGEWFTDELADMGSKDSSLQTQGVWIVEISELDAFRRSDVARIKAFMSRSTNRFRPPYGRHPIEFPRQCIFAASTNKETYFEDETGNRRFWPVRCHEDILIDDLARDRNQIWAEAMHKYRDGQNWWLEDKQIILDAQEEQARRFEADPWEARILEWLASKADVSITQILENCIVKPTKDWTQADRQRIGKCLRSLHWIRYQNQHGEWRFRRSFGARQEEFFE